MRLAGRIGPIYVHLLVRRVYDVTGINSKLEDGRHILLWDFDEKPLDLISAELEAIQAKHCLSAIYIVNTGLEDYYHAYCFTALDWVKCREIIASTPTVDRIFLALGIMRGYFTLRISPKRNRKFKLAKVLESSVEPEVNPYSLGSFEEYFTSRG